MVRTQIYLTDEERRRLIDLAESTGRQQSELIREAVDAYLDRQAATTRDAVLRRTAGLWQDRSDLPDFDALRREWDRDHVDRA
jgi:Arc/MetJ-type ribon-helix-helix transcriptional regulator